MDPEVKKILEKTLKLAEENNVMLHKVRGVQKRMAFYSFLRFLLLIGVTFGLFYYLQPYLTKIMDFFMSFKGMKEGINTGGIPLGDFFKQF